MAKMPIAEPRLYTTTEKIPKSITGLNGALFVHVNHTKKAQIRSVRFSFKGKDDSTLDKVLVALGDSVTSILREIHE